MARKKKEETQASEAKSAYAQARPRVNGRFVSADKLDVESLVDGEIKQELAAAMPPKKIKKEDAIVDNRVIPEEVREAVGTDSKAFFEQALKHARTWYEAAKYAKELKPLQHPNLSSVAVQQEIKITKKVLVWEWEGDKLEDKSDNSGMLIEHDADGVQRGHAPDGTESRD